MTDKPAEATGPVITNQPSEGGVQQPTQLPPMPILQALKNVNHVCATYRGGGPGEPGLNRMERIYLDQSIEVMGQLVQAEIDRQQAAQPNRKERRAAKKVSKKAPKKVAKKVSKKTK